MRIKEFSMITFLIILFCVAIGFALGSIPGAIFGLFIGIYFVDKLNSRR